MRKLGLILVNFIVIFIMASCEQVEILPMENPEPELFSVFYVGDSYEILLRSSIDEEIGYVSLAYGIEADEGYSCIAGASVIYNYRILASGEYYNIQTGSHLGLYTGNELEELGIAITCTESE